MKDRNDIRDFVAIGLVFLGLLVLLPIAYYLFSEHDSAYELRKRFAKQHLEVMAEKLYEFAEHEARFPEKLVDLVELPDDLIGKIEPLTKIPNDPWGRDYLYNVDLGSVGASFSIMTLGLDGEIGGKGENDDISFSSNYYMFR